MSTSNVQFAHQEFLAARKRYNFGIVDYESDVSRSSLESLGGDETTLLSASRLTSTFVTPLEVLRRLGFSLVPPIHPSRVLLKPPVDPVGPALVVTLLISLIIYASSKTPPFEYQSFEAILIVISYLILSSLIVFSVGKLFCGRFPISFLQVLALLGYSLFGHLLSLLISYTLYTYPEPPYKVMDSVSVEGRAPSTVSPLHGTTLPMSASSLTRDYDEGNSIYGHAFGAADEVESNGRVNNLSQWGDTAFLLCLVFVAGPATLRIVLILLSPIQSPPGRMLLGTILCLSHLLLLIILHASFFHPTFQYGGKG